MFSSYVNHQLTSYMALQGGVGVNYTRGTYYKTIRDLLGGEFWIDIDPFSDREISIAPDMLQNNLDNPNRHVTKGDKFGYNYDIDVLKVNGWLQNTITLPQWDVNYGLEMSYTMFQRDGKWRNGRAPNNSLGKGQIHRFDNAMFKAGATYKNKRTQLPERTHVQMGTRAPLVESVYISPRVKRHFCRQSYKRTHLLRRHLLCFQLPQVPWCDHRILYINERCDRTYRILR